MFTIINFHFKTFEIYNAFFPEEIYICWHYFNSLCFPYLRTPENWLNHGIIENIRYPLPAQAFLPTVDSSRRIGIEDYHTWLNVAVTDYNFSTKFWSVLTLDGSQRKFELPRLNIMFKAEDPENFAKRIEQAVHSRDETENIIRYLFVAFCTNLYIFPERYLLYREI